MGLFLGKRCFDIADEYNFFYTMMGIGIDSMGKFAAYDAQRGMGRYQFNVGLVLGMFSSNTMYNNWAVNNVFPKGDVRPIDFKGWGQEYGTQSDASGAANNLVTILEDEGTIGFRTNPLGEGNTTIVAAPHRLNPQAIVNINDSARLSQFITAWKETNIVLREMNKPPIPFSAIMKYLQK